MYIPSLDDHVKYRQHPWQVHSLKTERMNIQCMHMHIMGTQISFQLLVNIEYSTVLWNWLNWEAQVHFFYVMKIWHKNKSLLVKLAFIVNVIILLKTRIDFYYNETNDKSYKLFWTKKGANKLSSFVRYRQASYVRDLTKCKNTESQTKRP